MRSNRLTETQRIETFDALYTAAGSVKGRDKMKMFLRDLLTESERIMLGRRILIARSLLKGTTYEEIASTLSVGSDTVSKVEHWLEDQIPGYEEAIKGFEMELDNRDERRRLGRMSADKSWAGMLARLKRKYPLHFLFFPWPEQYKPKKK